MNSVAVALAEAAATAKTRAELAGAFDRAWSRVEFAPESESVVVPVDTQAARDWWLGDLSDLSLALSVTRRPAAIWWAALPRHNQFRPGLAAVRRLYCDGAALLVCQTRNPVLIRHGRRYGFRVHQFPDGAHRLMADAPALARWLGRLVKS